MSPATKVIKASTINAAVYERRANLAGSLTAGKQEVVFKQGWGYDPKKLVDAVRGKAGLY